MRRKKGVHSLLQKTLQVSADVDFRLVWQGFTFMLLTVIIVRSILFYQ